MTSVDAARRRDLLLAVVMLCIALTPGWLLPPWLARPWVLAVVVLAAPSVWFAWRHAPWVPTPRAELPRILRALALRPGERFCDLGAGDGRIVSWVHAATGATCVGVEATPLLAAVGWLRTLGVPGARVRLGDLYATDLSAFDVVYVWGTPYSVGTPGFRAFVDRAMRPGARLVSYGTPLDGAAPIDVDRDGIRPLFTYRIGPDASAAAP